MSAIIIPNRWTRQPTQPVEVDWSHPFAMGVQEAHDVANCIDLKRGTSLTQVGSSFMPQVVTKFGLARLGGSNRLLRSPPLNNLSDAQLGRTTLIFCQTNGSNGRLLHRGVAGGANTTATERFGVVSGTSYFYNRVVGGADIGNSLWTIPTPLEQTSSVVITNDGVTKANTALYNNGTLVTRVSDSAAAMTAAAATTDRLYFGGAGNAGFTPAMKLALTLVWPRILSLGEIREISRNPWQIFKPLVRRIYFDMAAGTFQAAWARNRSQVIGAGVH